MWCPQLFCCCMFIFVAEAISCHWLWMESKWLKKDIYGYKQCVKWHSGAIWITYKISCLEKKTVNAMPTIILLLHVRIWHQGHHLSLVKNGGKKEWRRTCTDTSCVSNNIVAGLYGSYTMSWIEKKAINAMPTILLLLHVHILHQGHPLSLVDLWLVLEQLFFVVRKFRDDDKMKRESELSFVCCGITGRLYKKVCTGMKALREIIQHGRKC
jgi:hypothetical protein